MTTRRFHSRRGGNIDLLDNNTLASRVRSYNYGIAFTEQPVALGTVFQVKIIEYRNFYGSIVSV